MLPLLENGENQLKQGQLQTALADLQQALAIAQKSNDRQTQANAHTLIAEAYIYQEQYPKALNALQQALEVYRSLGDRAGQGGVLNRMGWLYLSQSDWTKAKEPLQQAIVLLRTPNPTQEERYQEADTVSLQGAIAVLESRTEDGRKLLEEALKLSQASENRRAEANTLSFRGTWFSQQKNYEQAIAAYQQADQIYQQIGRAIDRIIIFSSLHSVYVQLKQYPNAQKVLIQGVELARKFDSKKQLASMLNSLGELQASELKQPKEGIQTLEEALRITREIGDRTTELEVLFHLSSAYPKVNQYDKAIASLKIALTINRDLQKQSSTDELILGEILILQQFGMVLEASDRRKEAIPYLQQGLAIIEKADKVAQKYAEAKLLGKRTIALTLVQPGGNS